LASFLGLMDVHIQLGQWSYHVYIYSCSCRFLCYGILFVCVLGVVVSVAYPI